MFTGHKIIAHARGREAEGRVPGDFRDINTAWLALRNPLVIYKESQVSSHDKRSLYAYGQ